MPVMPSFPTIEEAKAAALQREARKKVQWEKARKRLPYAIGVLSVVALVGIAAAFTLAPGPVAVIFAGAGVLAALTWAGAVVSNYIELKDRS